MEIKIFTEQPKYEKVFFYVFVEGKQAPKRKHESLMSAKIEAQRLAKITNHKVYILQAIKSYNVELIETSYLNDKKKNNL